MSTIKTYHIFQYLQSYREWKIIGLFFFFFLLNIQTVKASDSSKEIILDPINTYDEVPIEIIVEGYLRFEADVIITDKRLVYINVEELSLIHI